MKMPCPACEVLIDTTDDVLAMYDAMSQHIETCEPSQAVLADAGQRMLVLPPDSDAEEPAPVGGWMLVLSQPIFEHDEDGDHVQVGSAAIYFGPYDTQEQGQAEADRYLLSMAGINCGDDDCTDEHAHSVSVIAFHRPDALDKFIADERADWEDCDGE